MIYRVFAEKKDDPAARKTKSDAENLLKIKLEDVRTFIRYDVEGLTREEFEDAKCSVFSEPPVDNVYEETIDIPDGYDVFAIAYLPGQYDQRADSASQCVQLMTMGERPVVRCATVYAVKGASAGDLARLKAHLINPVESEEVSQDKPSTLSVDRVEAADVKSVAGFVSWSDADVLSYHDAEGLAMSGEDLLFVRDYFRGEKRDPTETEIKVIDTYWSDHCRHTTFLTEINDVEIDSDNPHIGEALDEYRSLFAEINGGREDKYMSLMDMATIASKKLRKDGKIPDLDESEEINACSIKMNAEIDGMDVPYTVMFKNETHNHPTEIEPFGGAATCLGGAIRDPLAGRTYVVQGMRVTGSGDPTEPIENTLPGKLPQRILTKTAAAGFSSYGNQIGLATGLVDEIYHPGYRAKRLETGFVVGGAPSDMIRRERPAPGDVIILLGGETGRDGCGGATGSSKAHDKKSVQTCGAEVQKGNALTERKLQRLMLNREATGMIKRCNDFGAGGVAVAIGELAPGLRINLDAVPKKYEGLSGTELAISESQERMAVVVDRKDVDAFIRCAAEENLAATPVASVTDGNRMIMTYRGRDIVDISREFLNTNGVKQTTGAEIVISSPAPEKEGADKDGFSAGVKKILSDENVADRKGLSELFDSTIGARSVYMPFGGKYQLTPAPYMASKLFGGETDDCTVSSYGFDLEGMCGDPFTGAIYSVVLSLSKIVSAGAKYSDARLTFQEYFMRLRDDRKRWGVPVAALLGAMHAQLRLGVASVGGKDSMSGSFEDMDVPPTLISFALAPAKASRLVTNVLSPSDAGKELFLLPVEKDAYGMPDFDRLRDTYTFVYDGIQEGKITFAQPVERGGVISAVTKSCLGNMTGVSFSCGDDALFGRRPGDIIIIYDGSIPVEISHLEIGVVSASDALTCGEESISLKEACAAYDGRLSDVFPYRSGVTGPARCEDFGARRMSRSSMPKVCRPRVFIPAFPGTNCELDTAAAFERAGAETEILVIKNRSPKDIAESVDAVVAAVSRANIIAFPGGFSGGDEPDGSGKFITATFRNPKITDEIMKLLYDRDGLAIGICNGFQALIKLGLLPYGNIRPQSPMSPTLTYNDIGRHVSALVDIRVSSVMSPWLSACRLGEIYTVPVSHGEGRFVCPDSEGEVLLKHGQVATQYAGPDGLPTMESPYNPNGSCLAVEGITSPDGRIYGKMGHSERTGKNLYINCPGNYDMKIFESGVKYFS